MEIQIKKAIRAGNSSAVVLPRAWLNKEVRVELVKKSQPVILRETIDILRDYLDIGKVIGIYLVGSYARGEEDNDSDIDVLVITDGIDVKMISERAYNILVVSSDLIKYKLEKDLLPIGPMIKEAIPLINTSYIDSIEINPSKKNLYSYIKTTDEKIDLVKRALNKIKNKVSDSVLYTLVLRIRTLQIIEKLIKNQKYSKKEFVNLIKKISGGEDSYQAYLNIKNNLGDKCQTSVEEATKLLYYLEKELKRVKSLF